MPGRDIEVAVDRFVRDPPLGLVGKVRRSQEAICSGDQSSVSFNRTNSRSPSCRSSFDAFGRRARSHVAASAFAARYASRPPLRVISRDTEDAERPILDAIARADSPAAMPRDISSRSTSESLRAARLRGNGRMPPVSARCLRTAAGPQRTARAIIRAGSPARHLSQIASCCSNVNAELTRRLSDRPHHPRGGALIG